MINTGVYSILRTQVDGNTPGINYAVLGESINSGPKPNPIMGVRGNAKFAKENVGVFGEAVSAGIEETTVNNIGVYGIADNSSNNAIENIGVYGEAVGTGFAGYFAGPAVASQPVITISDESVKTDVESLSGATEILNQLIPRTYSYTPVEGRENLFEDALQYGFVAQEVQVILPEIVKDASIPARFDSTGFVEGTRIELMGIQYEKLIPFLVAGFQEQNTEMAAQIQENEALQEQVSALEDQLQTQAEEINAMKAQMSEVMASFQRNQSKMTNCCGTAPTEKANSETGKVILEQNFPNPFEEVTTINFSLDKPAQIRLEISDAQGRVLEVLLNKSMNEGKYTERWDATAYAPGTYYYSLYADTELLTKKMIKR